VRFFEAQGHRRVPSSSLIPPPEERTLLFTNAGMNQMKPYFMGLAEPVARRLISIQKCFRTSDVEEVGDNRHCTFFEMLGNFSVGDYFKAEVIPWAWQLLTSPEPEGMGLDPQRLWATIYNEDEESHDLWRSVGVPEDRIVRYGEKENYWFMGRVGPCGPNTEISYDFGAYEGYPEHPADAPCHPNCELPGCHRFLELWNLVFMTLFQDEDGSRRPLPQRNVDTGGGLERWPLPQLWQKGVDWQGKPKRWTQPPTIYDSAAFQPVLQTVGKIAGKQYYEAPEAEQRAMRVVAEHARAATFLINDGVRPANDGRGYILRRLIRRGMYFGASIGVALEPVAARVVEHMAPVYAELSESRDVILRIVGDEERRFNETMHRGGTELDAEITALEARGETALSGARAFYFQATLGFPIELTREIAAKRGIEVDESGFEAEDAKHRTVSAGGGGHFEADAERIQTYADLGLAHTEFVGYESTRALGIVNAILLDGTTIVRSITPELAAGHRVEVVLDQTPFYAEGGGQVGDRGVITSPGSRFVVEDTQAVGDGGVVAHIGRLEEGTLSVADPVEARVDEGSRNDTMRNHTATHILHAALRQVLGPHARQAGSLVTPERLRFDFTHLEAMTPAQIREVETLANRVVRDDMPVHVQQLGYEEALAAGALAFFGDKYADVVRVVGVCTTDQPHDENECFSRELCGGTHVHSSGSIGAIVVTGETSIGAGLRRIEAVTGRAAIERIREHEDALARVGSALRVAPGDIEARVQALREENDNLRKQLQATERRLARTLVEAAKGGASEAADEGEMIGDVRVVVQRVNEAPGADFLRDIGDGYKQRYATSVVLLGAVIDGKPSFLAMSTPDVAKRVSAGDIVRAASQAAGGGGGGRPELAQGGGSDPAKLDAALAAGRKMIEDRLKA
jgi:alanyl-tRNA synthetase